MTSFDWDTRKDWPTPREAWSPALDDGKKKVRLLLSLIPDGIYVKTRDFPEILVLQPDLRSTFAFIVALPGAEEQSNDMYGLRRGQVFLFSDGRVTVTEFVRKLIQGKVEGFEEWDRWPWPNELQPPPPRGWKQKKIDVYI